MTVAKVNYGKWTTLIGTIAEVMQAIEDEGISREQCLTVFYNGTNITGIYRKG